jgi:hypothetical protein
MELLEGETVEKRIASKPLTLVCTYINTELLKRKESTIR